MSPHDLWRLPPRNPRSSRESAVSRRNFMEYTLATGATWGCLGSCGCRSVPETDRKQLLLMPESQELSLGAQAFSQVTTDAPVSTNTAMTEVVQRVGKRIAKEAKRSDYQWEFKLLASDEKNAFCLPGGKVAIHEGILPVCQNEAGLAVVMSHEVAHALARHGGERMSQNMASQGVQQIVSRVAKKHVPTREELLMQAYGIGSEYLVLLPYSRKQESEADHIGIMLMSKAGYDPSEAPKFWSRFGSLKDGQQTFEFLSTHPSDERRQSDLLALIDEARQHYLNSPQIGLGQDLIRA
ncbi:MAG: M48 family metallopeptidase [Pirellulaceae bacterium]|nr:M48 family metallopeptidase [Pirellulaceae bacterium]